MGDRTKAVRTNVETCLTKVEAKATMRAMKHEGQRKRMTLSPLTSNALYKGKEKRKKLYGWERVDWGTKQSYIYLPTGPCRHGLETESTKQNQQAGR